MVAAPERSPMAPDVPTSSEAGLEGFVFQGWNAVFAPRGTPLPVVAKLSGALSAALEAPAVRRRIEELGSVPPRPDQTGPDALRELVRSEVERWAVVVRAAGIGEP